MSKREANDAVENKKSYEPHSNGKYFSYVLEKTNGENNIDSAPKDEIEREEVRDGEVVNFKNHIEFTEEYITHFAGELVRHEGVDKFTEWLASELEKGGTENDTEKAVENTPPHTRMEEERHARRRCGVVDVKVFHPVRNRSRLC